MRPSGEVNLMDLGVRDRAVFDVRGRVAFGVPSREVFDGVFARHDVLLVGDAEGRSGSLGIAGASSGGSECAHESAAAACDSSSEDRSSLGSLVIQAGPVVVASASTLCRRSARTARWMRLAAVVHAL